MNQERFESLISRYYASAVRAASRARHAVADAEDAAQHAAIIMHRRWATGEFDAMTDQEFGRMFAFKAKRYSQTLWDKLVRKGAGVTHHRSEEEPEPVASASDEIEARDFAEAAFAVAASEDRWVLLGMSNGESVSSMAKAQGLSRRTVDRKISRVREEVLAAIGGAE